MNNNDIIQMSENYSEALNILRAIYFQGVTPYVMADLEGFLIEIGEITEY